MDLSVWACGMEVSQQREKNRRTTRETVIRESRASCALHLACRKSACTGLFALWPVLLSVLTSVSHKKTQVLISDLRIHTVFCCF